MILASGVDVALQQLTFVTTAAHSQPVGVPHGGNVEERDGERAQQNLDDVDFDRDSTSSSDSFHSTLESLDDSDVSELC